LSDRSNAFTHACDNLAVVTTDDVELDAETLRAELALRWPDAVDAGRACTDEQHRLVLLHSQYDGFVTLEVTARTDLEGVFVLPDEQLASVVTAHHRTGPVARGQQLPIDLELHPGNVQRGGIDGELRLVDTDGADVAPAVRMTVATDDTLDCVLAGLADGPFEPADFERAVSELLAGRGDARRLARRVTSMQAGDDDPGWGRRGWLRR
jgi:hypothetical protein